MTLFLGLLFGAIGSGFLIYAKRQHSAWFAVTGILLVVCPYFFSSALVILVIGTLLTAAPFAIQRYFV